MEIEMLLVIGVPLASFVLSIWLTYVLGTKRNVKMLAMLGGVWAVTTLGLFIGMFEASGYDGLAYLFALLGFSAPGGVGALIGGIMGWMKKDNESYVGSP